MFLLCPVIQFLCRKGSSGSDKAAQPKNQLVKKPTSAVLLFVGRCSHVVRYVRVWSWENFSHLHNQAPVSILYEVHASFRETVYFLISHGELGASLDEEIDLNEEKHIID